MSCETLRKRLAEDPASIDAELEHHADNCDACRAYRDRLLRAEELIQEALRFDIASLRRAEAGQPRASGSRSRWVTWASGLAAGLLVGVASWTFLVSGRYLTPEELAAVVVKHWYHEPYSWVESDSPVSAALLAEVLDGDAEINRAALRTISYAETCWVAGQWIPHFVVQGEAGPYMILLMPGRILESRVPLALPAEGLRGHIVPVGAGSIAILGGGQSAEIERMEDAVVSAVDWTI